MYVCVCVCPCVQLLLVCILKMKKNEFWGLFKISDLVKTTCPLIHVPQYTLIIHIFLIVCLLNTSKPYLLWKVKGLCFVGVVGTSFCSFVFVCF